MSAVSEMANESQQSTLKTDILSQRKQLLSRVHELQRQVKASKLALTEEKVQITKQEQLLETEQSQQELLCEKMEQLQVSSNLLEENEDTSDALLDSLSKETAAIEARCTEKSVMLEEATRRFSALEETYVKVRHSRDEDREKKKAEGAAEVQELMKTAEKHAETLEKMKETCASVAKDLELEQVRAATLTEQLTLKRKEEVDLKEKLNETTEKLNTEEAALNGVSTQLVELNDIRSGMRTELAELEEHCAQLKADHDTSTKRSKEEVDTLEAEVARLTSHTEEARKKTMLLTDEYLQAQRRFNETQVEIENTQRSTTVKQAELSMMKAQREAMEDYLRDLKEKEHTEVQLKIEAVDKVLLAKKGETNIRGEKMSDLKVEIEQTKEKLDELRKMGEALKTNLENEDQTVNDLKARKESVEKEKSELELEIAKAKQTETDVMKELEELKVMMDGLSTDEVTQEELEKEEGLTAEAQENLKTLKETLSSAKAELEEVSKSLQEGEQEKLEATAEYEKLQKQIATARGDLKQKSLQFNVDLDAQKAEFLQMKAQLTKQMQGAELELQKKKEKLKQLTSKGYRKKVERLESSNQLLIKSPEPSPAKSVSSSVLRDSNSECSDASVVSPRPKAAVPLKPVIKTHTGGKPNEAVQPLKPVIKAAGGKSTEPAQPLKPVIKAQKPIDAMKTPARRPPSFLNASHPVAQSGPAKGVSFKSPMLPVSMQKTVGSARRPVYSGHDLPSTPAGAKRPPPTAPLQKRAFDPHGALSPASSTASSFDLFDEAPETPLRRSQPHAKVPKVDAGRKGKSKRMAVESEDELDFLNF